MGFQLNPAEAERLAQQDFGVTRPLLIEARDELAAEVVESIDSDGFCVWDFSKRRHLVVVRSTLGAVAFLETLAHELAHCVQRETYLRRHPTEQAGIAAFDAALVADRDSFEAAARAAESEWWRLAPAITPT